MVEHLPLLDDSDGSPDYFVDMIEQLAERAREIGELEVAVHLEALAAARRQTLENVRKSRPKLKYWM